MLSMIKQFKDLFECYGKDVNHFPKIARDFLLGIRFSIKLTADDEVFAAYLPKLSKDEATVISQLKGVCMVNSVPQIPPYRPIGWAYLHFSLYDN